jgi:citrate synthase
MSDIYSSVTSAVGALKGPLHGGANTEVVKMLLAIEKPEKAEQWVLERLAAKAKIPGFGHRVYRCEDPRVSVLRKYAKSISIKQGDSRLYDITRAVEQTMLDHSKVFANVDLYTASLYHAMDIPAELFTPIFAISRVVGWTAHILEQWGNNRLIRPRAEYIGPTGLKYISIEDRIQ